MFRRPYARSRTVIAMQTSPALESSRWSGRIFDGTWSEPRGGGHDVVDKATGAAIGRVGIASPADIAVAAKAAAAAQPGWAATPPRDRAQVFYKAIAFFEAHAAEMAAYISKETGSILAKAQHEVREVSLQLQLAASLILQPQGLLLPTAPGRLNYARRVPHGVVGVISPFNFPLLLSMRSTAPALACGNAVVLKPDPQTPVTGGFFLARAFEEAGLPPGVLHVLPGGADAGEALCTDPHVRMVTFTGSTAAGRRVGELCGKHLKKVALELGGKNSLIILEDADLDRAASNVAWGAYFHQGQVCMSTGRVLVHEKIAAELTQRLVTKANHLPVGDPATGQVALGPLINERQRDRVHAIVQDSIREGAKLEAGGTFDKLFYKPTVLSAVRPTMRAFREEVFGPVANIITFKTDDEAIALANDTDYGLSGAIISKSIGRAMALGDRLHTGLVHINDQTVNDESTNPFGGRGSSGNGGTMGGPADLDEYTQWKWVTIKDEAPAYPF
jgi:benzaldehyde dehydrogenase (NAD)